MSAGSEANFELGYRVNVNATRSVLDHIATTCYGVKVLYASSEAVYGRPVPSHAVTEDDLPTPETSYGCQKMICETLINDYTRRGLINGLSLRFPTISVRPGTPSAAVTTFLSSIIREPFNGLPCTVPLGVPLGGRSWCHWMSSLRTLVHNIMIALALPREVLPLHQRPVNMPSFAVTLQDMLDALEDVGGQDMLALVREQEVPELG